MQRNLILSGLIALIYFLGKTIEVKFISHKEYILKNILKETLFVYISAYAGIFLLEQIELMNVVEPTAVFTNNPKF